MSYINEVAIGVYLRTEDVFDVQQTEWERKCGHPEAEGHKFCPECGFECKTVQGEIRKLKEPWAFLRPILADKGLDEDELDCLDFDLLHEWEGPNNIKFLSMEVDGDEAVLGLSVETFDPGCSHAAVSLETFKEGAKRIREALDDLGVLPGARIMVYCWSMYS